MFQTQSIAIMEFYTENSMAEWEKEIAVIKTDVRYIRDDVNIMQKQIRDLNKASNMGLGVIKVLLVVGSVLAAIWAFVKMTD